MDTKHYTSDQVVEALTKGDDDLSKAVKDKVKSTRIIRELISLRAQSGKTQAEVAEEMGCSPERVAEIEFGNDEDITLREVLGYTKALGFTVT